MQSCSRHNIREYIHQLCLDSLEELSDCVNSRNWSIDPTATEIDEVDLWHEHTRVLKRSGSSRIGQYNPNFAESGAERN